jgi:outer membrane protein OmpA-like peptidoglycan-associated protein
MGTRYTIPLRAGLAALAVVLTPAPAVQAEPLQLEAHAGLAKAFGGYQASETSVGFGGALGVNLPFSPEFGVDGRLGLIFLGDGQAPKEPTFKDGGSATAFAARLGVQVRPWGAAWGQSALSGLWLSAGGGATLTGGLLRPLSEFNLGYDFVFAEEGVGIGPMLTHVHVFQPDSALRPDDANVFILGVHIVMRASGQAPVDLDPDKDAILDPDDRCPAAPEDRDGFEDTDGCPDADNDGDGIVDTKDGCPANAEDMDGFQDKDGCPEADNDRDTVLDKDDQCPVDEEDLDGFEDKDGCPELDNDKDGFPDSKDACPNEAEIKNGYADEDGCPDSEQVRVVGDRIILDEKVHFQVNNANIRRVSHGLLQRVAQLILDNPDYIHIEVQGHADRKGDAEFNMKLSAARAESVMQFLVADGGIEASRMSFRGFGEDQPLLNRDDEWALFMNRRVEFKITRQSDSNKPVQSSGAPLPTPSLPPSSSASPADAAVPATVESEQTQSSAAPEASGETAEPPPPAAEEPKP